jgi:hypothetical protein
LTIAITSNRLLIGDQPSQLVREALLETCGECRVLALIKFLEALAHVSPTRLCDLTVPPVTNTDIAAR